MASVCMTASSIPLAGSWASLQGTGCARGHRAALLGCTHHCHPAWVCSRARMTPCWRGRRVCGIRVTHGQDYPCRGTQFPRPSDGDKVGQGWGLTAPDRLCQRLLAHGLCLPHLSGEEDHFPACKPHLACSRAPSKQPYLDLIFQVLGSGHQGLDLAEREGSVPKAVPRDTHTAAPGLALTSAWSSSLRLPTGSAAEGTGDQHRVQDLSLPRRTHHGPNPPARRSSSSPRLCW